MYLLKKIQVFIIWFKFQSNRAFIVRFFPLYDLLQDKSNLCLEDI
jgi:hypothetical protein